MKTDVLVSILIIFISLVAGDDETSNIDTLHKKMIARRREEHFSLMKNIATNSKYEIRFRLIVVGLDKVYEIIKVNRDILKKEGDTGKITEAKMTIIENTCLLMDFMVNFNIDDMIYKALKKLKNEHWLEDLKFCISFLEKYVDLLDELTTKQFEFVKSIMPNIVNLQPLPEYPYENSVKEFLHPDGYIQSAKKEKKKRKLKKGPTLINDPGLKSEL